MKLNSSKYNQHWHDKKLSDLGEFSRGKSRHRPRNDPALFSDGSIPLIQTGEIREAALFVSSHSECYNELGLSQSKLWPKGTLCITIAANIAETAILEYPMCFPDSVVGFQSNDEESSELFLHYVFSFIRRSIQNSVQGSIQDNINIDYLTSFEFKIPHKRYQDDIVRVLANLDRKIALNDKINAELKGRAKLIYDYWFIQFDFPNENGKPYKSSGGKMVRCDQLKRDIPEGWETVQLGNMVRTVLGGTPASDIAEYWNDGAIPWLSSGEVSEFPVVSSNDFVTEKGIQKSAAQLLPRGTTVISIVRHLRVSFLAIEAATNQSVVGVCENETMKSPFLCLMLQRNIPRLMTLRTGAQQPHINKEEVDRVKFAKPPAKTLEKFYSIARPYFELIESNAIQNQELANLRNWLLPMLMNGQVTVGE